MTAPRSSIPLFCNPVIAQGSAAAPTGVTVDITREIAARLDVPVGTEEFRSREFLHGLVEELKASGFVADALRRSGQEAAVAPPA